MYYFLSIVKKFSLVFILFTLILLSSFELTQAYTDDFTSDPASNPNWTVQNGKGLTFDSPGITLSSSNSGSFPYIKTSSLVDLSLDTYYEIRFQYIFSGSPWGVGGSFTDNAPDYPTNLNTIEDYLKFNIAYFWGDKLHSVTSLCPIFSIDCPSTWWFIYPNSPPSKDFLTSTISDYFVHTFSMKRTSVDTNLHIYDVYLDGNLIFESKPTNRLVKSIWIGHPSNLGGSKNWPILKIFSVKSYATKPTDFPYLSQLDPLWGDIEYDSAINWAGVDNSGIDRWGCALTSAAMVLQEYGIKSTYDKLVDPADLNEWLKNQDDGYVGLGLINWIAVSRYAREQYTLDLSPTKLEFERSYLPSAPLLPSILDLGGHFVVAHNEKDLNWIINDPNDEKRTELAKTTSVKSINRFVPSETDLSYMLFTLSPDATGILKNELGEVVDLNWIQEYIDSDQDESQSPAIKTAMIPKPSNGKYVFEITLPDGSSGEAKVYLYDDQANEIIPTTYLLTQPLTSIQIDYDSEVEKSRTSLEMDLTPPSIPEIISPLNDAYVNTTGLVLDWADVTDPSSAVTYNYKSVNSTGSVYGPVSTGTRSYINAPNTPDNTYVWQVQACDSVGNCSGWSSSSLTVDSTKPSTPSIIKPREDEYFRNIPILNEWSQSADNVGVDYYRIQYEYDDLHKFSNYPYRTTTSTSRNHTPNINEQGGVSYRVQAIDKAGNESEWSEWRHYIYDATNPVLNGPPTTAFLTNSTIQIWSWMAATDSVSGINGYSTRTFDTVSQSYLNDWLWIGNVLGVSTNLSEGLWSLELKARDNAGNESTPLMSNILNVDLTAPVTPTLLSPANYAIVNGNYLLSDWSDSPEASKYIYESYNDSELINLRFRQEYSLSQKSASKVAESQFWWRVQAQDLAGNKSSWSTPYKVTIDNSSPQLVSKTEFEGWYNTPQTSYFDFTDPHIVPGYLAPNCEIPGDGGSQTCSVSPNICDLAGNCFTTALTSNPAKIDTIKPNVSLNAWGSTIDGTASDKLSGIKKVSLKIFKPSQDEITVDAIGTINWSYTMSDAPFGPYRIALVAYDNAGNVSEEIVKTFVMSPAATQTVSSSVAGATSKAEPKIEPVINPTTGDKKIAENIVNVSPSPKVIPSDHATGAVLGETVENTEKTNYWWLITGLIAAGSSIFALIIYFTKKI